LHFQFVEHRPPEALRPFLRRSFYACGKIPYRYDKILPNGLAVAIFTLGAPHRLGSLEAVDQNRRFDHSWFHGVQSRPVYNLPIGETHVLGLLFEPIGFHALFGTDMRKFADKTVDARQVLPPDFVQTIETVLPAAREKAAHLAIHDALLARSALSLPPWQWAFYETLKSTEGAIPLARAYRQTGCSPRHVSDRFKRSVGATPKVLSRIYRLNALLGAVDPTAPISWTDLAHRFGFFDQAHFNREFRRFSGLSPSRYSAERQREFPDLQQGENVSFVPQN
jgi:AraC-like DNA-binding protein